MTVRYPPSPRRAVSVRRNGNTATWTRTRSRTRAGTTNPRDAAAGRRRPETRNREVRPRRSCGPGSSPGVGRIRACRLCRRGRRRSRVRRRRA
eukprot:31271-Pelagococcus_subviridis.AAC.2